MQLTKVLCCVFLMMTITTTCIQANNGSREIKENKLEKRVSRRTTTIVVDSMPSKMLQQSKLVYRKMSPSHYVPPKSKYGPRRTKYGPPRTLRKPGKKYRGKTNQRHAQPFPHKKRGAKPKYGPHKKPFGATHGYSKKSPNRQYNSVGFGEPPSGYSGNKYLPPKPTEFSRPHEPDHRGYISNPHAIDFSSPATFDDFENKPFENDFSPPHTFSSSQGYGEPPVLTFDNLKQNQLPLDSYGSPLKPDRQPAISYGSIHQDDISLEKYPASYKPKEPPVDSYGAPIQPNLRDLTFSAAQSHIISTSDLDDDENFKSESRPWKDHKNIFDNTYTPSKIRPVFIKLKESEDIFVTPIPDKPNEELNLNSYSDIYSYRQAHENKMKKKRVNYNDNIQILNNPWKGPKLIEGSKIIKGGKNGGEIIVGGKYAEPPARIVSDFQPSLSMLKDENSFFGPLASFPDSDESVPISSYVNYKNSNMAFSPQNLNDAFSIVDTK